ncbi:hypothetical protein CPC08DRAFT_688064 [Agrocybe pediades]|nr:hypothetical protein CPC08DRAFT_688064 [Agrocybe pediades]
MTVVLEFLMFHGHSDEFNTRISRGVSGIMLPPPPDISSASMNRKTLLQIFSHYSGALPVTYCHTFLVV